MIKTYKNINISWDINVSARNLQNRARFSEPVEMSPNSGMIKTYKNINIWVGYQCFCTKPSEQGSFFQAGWNEFQIVVCYDRNLQKHKYLSGISTFLHETFRTGLIFLSWSKWVQIVVRSKLSKTEISQWDINVSAWNLQNRAHFSEPVKMIPNSGMLWSKLTKT